MNDRNESVSTPVIEELVFPSRRALYGRLAEGLESSLESPVLLTGEAGSGKTWTARRLTRGAGPMSRWAWVDVAPEMPVADFLRQLLVQVGWTGTGGESAGGLRIALAEVLGQAEMDGRRWNLVVDELHLATASVLEELRILTNRQGQPEGFASILLLGQTRVVRMLAGWCGGSLGSRIGLHEHLRAIDAEDVREWLRSGGGASGLSERDLEVLHRDSDGNASMLRRLARGRRAGAGARLRLDAGHGPLFEAGRVEVSEAVGPAPSALGLDMGGLQPTEGLARPAALLPARPPLFEGEGLIEVGWPTGEGELEEGASASDEGESWPEASEEVVEDPYTALQAWQEWTAANARAVENGRRGDLGESEAEELGSTVETVEEIVEPTEGTVWGEPAQEFAPYGDLFSRNRPATPRDS